MTTVQTILRQIRILHWSKNLLLFLPLIGSHQIFEGGVLLSTVYGFCAFCLCASAVYILNDLKDIDLDRMHPIKMNRPLARGDLSPSWAYWSVPLLLASSFGLGYWVVSDAFALVLLAYLLGALVYSYWLKQVFGLDILVLATLYSLRVLAGGVASRVPVSLWLFSISVLLFVSLALVKRHTQLMKLQTGGSECPDRPYHRDVKPVVASFGSTTGFLSVAVFAFYIESDAVRELYLYPRLLWGLVPLGLWWISRLWLLSSRGKVDEDPVLFAVTDRFTYLVTSAALLILILASGSPFGG